jgi:hypothetical protein
MADLFKKINDGRKLSAERALQHARNPPSSVAASSEPVLGKRQPQGQPFERPAPQARVPGNQRVHSETMTQVEELQSVKDAGNIGAYKFEVCPGTKRAGACKAASPDRCKEWHVCYLCVKAGKVAAECFSHPAGPQCPEFQASKEKGAKYRKK